MSIVGCRKLFVGLRMTHIGVLLFFFFKNIYIFFRIGLEVNPMAQNSGIFTLFMNVYFNKKKILIVGCRKISIGCRVTQKSTFPKIKQDQGDLCRSPEFVCD